MADSKITALTALTAADPANDMMPIVDVSDTSMAASGTTKRISINNILACSPTATLASATITGALDAARLNVTAATIPANGVYLGSANNLSFSVASTLGMTLNSTGLGVGVTPSAWTTLRGLQNGRANLAGYANNSEGAWLTSNAFFDGNWKYQVSSQASSYQQLSGVHSWQIAGSGTAGTAITFTQAMTLDASGNLLVGTTSAAGVRLDVQTTTGNCIGRVKSNASASTASFIIDYVETLGCTYIKKAGSDVWIYGVQNDTSATPNFKINTASNVGVQLVAGSTAWTTLSDETVKDIIEPISNAIAKVGSLRSVIGKFKTDSEGTRRSFLIAQDVKSVLPEAVDVIGENNELGLRYTEVIPLLVAAIQELTARVQTLEAK